LIFLAAIIVDPETGLVEYMEQQIRNINQIEKQIVKCLVGKADIDFPDERYENVPVRKMDDGGMGNFSIYNIFPA
jgi:hypothetical protein